MTAGPGIEARGGAVRIRVRVTPRASRNGVSADGAGGIRVTVTAAPTDGEANDAVCRLLAKAIGVPPTAVAVVSGQKSRNKTVEVAGTDAGAVRHALAQAME